MKTKTKIAVFAVALVVLSPILVCVGFVILGMLAAIWDWIAGNYRFISAPMILGLAFIIRSIIGDSKLAGTGDPPPKVDQHEVGPQI